MHGSAHGWNATTEYGTAELGRLVKKLWAVASPERVRRSIQGVVQALDERLEKAALST